MLKLRDDHADVLGSSQNVQQGIEVIQQNIKWLDLNQAEIASWLEGLSTDAPPSTESTSTDEPTTEPSSTSSVSISSTPTSTTPKATTPSDGNSVYVDPALVTAALASLLYHRYY